MQKNAAPELQADQLVPVDQQLCFALYSASLAMTKMYKPRLDALGLTYPQYLVMLSLWEQDTQTVSQIGERLYLDSGTLSPLLKRLEAAGLIRRERATTDERRVQVTLTNTCRALKTRALGLPQHALRASGCTLGELTELTARLHALRRRLAESPTETAVQARAA